MPPTWRAAREIGIAELDRMTRLVEDIDLLATVEGDSYTMDDVDLGALTARVGELVAVIPDHAWSVEAMAEGDIQRRPGPPAAGLAAARRQRREVHPRRRADRDRQRARRSRARACGCATTDRASRRPRATASSAASTAPTASGPSAGRGSVSRSSTRSPRATAGGASSPTPRAAARPSPSTCLRHEAELPAPVRAGDVVLQREAAG